MNRHRAAVALLDDLRAPKPEPPPKPAPKPKSAPEFVCLPPAVWKHPPIRHRGDAPEVGLSALEYGLVGALTVLARAERRRARHEYSLRQGKEAITAFRAGGVDNCSALTAREKFQAWGADGYTRGTAKFNRQNSKTNQEVRCSKEALLRLAGLSANGRNRDLIPAALKRLTQPVGKFPPVVRGWEKLRGGELRLTVDSWWIPTKRFVRVPWPPPTKGTSTTTLALFLFLAGTDLRPNSKISIAAERLYKSLGIPPAHAKRSLERALACVNAHLAELKQPTFEMVSVEGGRVRFAAAEVRRAKVAKAKPAVAAKSKRPRKANSAAAKRQPAERRQAGLEAAQADKFEGWGDGLDGLDGQERERLLRRYAAPDAYLDDDELRQREAEERHRRESERREADREADRALARGWNERLLKGKPA